MIRKLYRRIWAFFRRRKEPYFTFYKILGFYPHNISLYLVAMHHRSSPMNVSDGQKMNNERLEFLGDAILDAIVADILFKRFQTKKEGFLTNLRSRIVKRETLNRLAVELGLDKLLVTSARTLAHNTNLYGDALEALIGAIYLDQGYRVAKKFVFETLIKEHLDIENVAVEDVDFKSRLIEWGQKSKLEVVFKLVETVYDEKNNPVFKTNVLVGGMTVGEGTGYSKKESHQKASKKALKRIYSDKSLREELLATLIKVDKDNKGSDVVEDIPDENSCSQD